jgi:glucose-6-phosphate 1-dehydrogenase
MFQNHLLAILSLTAMEPPASFDADCLRDEKAKVLRAIRPFDPAKLDKLIVPGQYTAGQIRAAPVPGYRQEPGVSPDSRTETFIAAKLFIDNQRWKDTPFYLRTGKRLACKLSEVAVVFKHLPHSIFAAVGLEQLPANVLVLKIQPAEGISLSVQAKRPGSKLCMSTLTMNFDYRQVFGAEPPDAYQRLLLDCMLGDQMLFDRYDAVELSWRLLTPVLNTWQPAGSARPHPYPAGSESFPVADSLIEADGRKWRRLSQNDT